MKNIYCKGESAVLALIKRNHSKNTSLLSLMILIHSFYCLIAANERDKMNNKYLMSFE